METETTRLTNIEAQQGAIFGQIAKYVAKENDVPMMAATWSTVLEEIEFLVECFLQMRFSSQKMAAPPEITAMAEIWRKLENEASRLRTGKMRFRQYAH